jgi:hypothetical protein
MLLYLTGTPSGAISAGGPSRGMRRITSGFSIGRLAQLVRAPASHAGGPGFESLTAHHSSQGPSTSLRISPASSDARNTAQVRVPDRPPGTCGAANCALDAAGSTSEPWPSESTSFPPEDFARALRRPRYGSSSCAGFVSGHDFSRAEKRNKMRGFSPCPADPATRK